MIKVRLYSTTNEWDQRHTAIKSHLNIPDGAGTTEYTDRVQVNNDSHADHGKYVFIVKTTGRWKCDDQFNPDELVNHDTNWFTSEGLE